MALPGLLAIVFRDDDFASTPLNFVENPAALSVVGTRPDRYFGKCTKATDAKFRLCVQFADIDAGRLNHSDQYEAVLLITHHLDGFQCLVAADADQHGEMQTAVTGGEFREI